MSEDTRKNFVAVVCWIDLILENIYVPVRFIKNLVNHRGSKLGNVILGVLTVKAILWWPIMLATGENRKDLVRMLKADSEIYDRVLGNIERFVDKLI